MNGILQWKQEIPSCLQVPVYKQSLLFMQIVVARKSWINYKREKNNSKRPFKWLVCGAYEHSLFFRVSPKADSKSEKMCPFPPCLAISKKCTFKSMTCEDESLWGIKSPAKTSHLKGFCLNLMQVRRQPIIPKFTRRRLMKRDDKNVTIIGCFHWEKSSP